MNFLAHAYLSFDQPKILVGNFIGDFVRGDLEQQFEKEIVNGIMLHREIDAFTDCHPLVKEAQSLLKPIFKRYATVITDMYFDYFLAKNWCNYDERPLESFVQWVYGVLRSHQAILPKKFLYPFKYMQQENWLVNYGTMEGLQRSFTGLSYRTAFESKMEKAPEFLTLHHDEFKDYFQLFFAELTSFSKDTLDQIAL
ncbi:Acyl carrier protein phosphodiesterase [Cyclobacterium lianum]|uniref:Acyl carrier protein phosphodiesterase n=1 Tax=Cyclobacterium lianum TaxID=388280 RepID=A0A1M7Q8S9_9BACT|nr:ACP phosphodiesterase [Cyclobacterium lianum]SHN27033.1 Acyl carrier protein phosphodiesterase [Cyclobacterium lianum]